MLLKNLEDLTISKNEPPKTLKILENSLGFENYYINKEKNIIMSFPRVGAFEIILNEKLIFSKLNSRCWPNIEAIALKIIKKIKGGEQEINEEDEKKNSPRKNSPIKKNKLYKSYYFEHLNNKKEKNRKEISLSPERNKKKKFEKFNKSLSPKNGKNKKFNYFNEGIDKKSNKNNEKNFEEEKFKRKLSGNEKKNIRNEKKNSLKKNDKILLENKNKEENFYEKIGLKIKKKEAKIIKKEEKIVNEEYQNLSFGYIKN